jgi:phasin
MRDFADKSVEQARRAFDSFISAAHKAADSMEGSTGTMQQSAFEASKQAVAMAEANVKAAFDLAQQLVQAKGMDEVMRLQTEYMQRQAQTMQEQMRNFASTMQKGIRP